MWLETDEPSSRPLRWGHSFHTRFVVPRLGAFLSDREAYRYLPASAAFLPDEAGLRSMLERAGFTQFHKRRHMFGAVQRITAVRGEHASA